MTMIKKAMLERGISVLDVQRVIGRCERTTRMKINGKSDWTLHEARKIHREIFPDFEFDVLFECA